MLSLSQFIFSRQFCSTHCFTGISAQRAIFSTAFKLKCRRRSAQLCLLLALRSPPLTGGSAYIKLFPRDTLHAVLMSVCTSLHLARSFRPSVARRITYARVGQPINCALSGRVAVLHWWGADVSISTDRREPIGILDGWLCTYGRTAAMFMRIIMWIFKKTAVCGMCRKQKHTVFELWLHGQY